MNKISNPVLKGFNPDPSCIRVGSVYYLVTSSFEWFPGVNLYQSTDLIHWEQLNSPLESVEMVDLGGIPASGGVWAPDLSYSDGQFWLVYTKVYGKNKAFTDLDNYVTTASNINGPWSNPVHLNGVGFDPSLFHDVNGKKYLVQQTNDYREFKHPFNGITITEFDPESMKLKPKTARQLFPGTSVGRTEGPHLYQIKDYYYLFVAEGGTSYEHQEVVARAKKLTDKFELSPLNPFVGNYDDPNSFLQKQGHGALFNTSSDEWYYASLSARPWHYDYDSAIDPRGWSTLGRETSIQKVEWSETGWPTVVGGHGGQQSVIAPKDGIKSFQTNFEYQDERFENKLLDQNWKTLRVPFNAKMGSINSGKLTILGGNSLSSNFKVNMIARRWQNFNFEAETSLQFSPDTYQQMAGMVNYYNANHWSWIFMSADDSGNRVINISEFDTKKYTTLTAHKLIKVPDNCVTIYFKVIVHQQSYEYQYSFDGQEWIDTNIELNTKLFSDEYVQKTYDGGFFTAPFVGLAAVDLSGYQKQAIFGHFKYIAK